MSRKTFIAIVLLLLAVLGALGWYFFLRTAPTGPDTATDPNDTDLFPFPSGQNGGNGGNDGGATTTTPVIDVGGSSSRLPALRKLWAEPTAGATFVASSSRTVSVRFVDRSTGHIYETPVESTAEKKISNVTIPQIYEALWASNGKEVVMRYLKDGSSIQSFYGVLATTTEATATSSPAIEGYFLPSGIREIAVAAGKILYFDPTSSNGVLIEANVSGTAKRVALTSDTSQWLISRNGAKSAFLSTKPSGTVFGFGYIFDVAKGTLTNAISDIIGLTGSMNPAGDRVFMSGAQGRGMASASYDVAGRRTLALSVATLSDKCAWSSLKSAVIYCAIPTGPAAGTYPDDWYQGNVSFNDTLWMIDAATGETSFVFDPQFEVLEDMDMFRMSVSPDDSYLQFTNKKDMSLWLYRLAP